MNIVGLPSPATTSPFSGGTTPAPAPAPTTAPKADLSPEDAVAAVKKRWAEASLEEKFAIMKEIPGTSTEAYQAIDQAFGPGSGQELGKEVAVAIQNSVKLKGPSTPIPPYMMDFIDTRTDRNTSGGHLWDQIKDTPEDLGGKLKDFARSPAGSIAISVAAAVLVPWALAGVKSAVAAGGAKVATTDYSGAFDSTGGVPAAPDAAIPDYGVTGYEGLDTSSAFDSTGGIPTAPTPSTTGLPGYGETGLETGGSGLPDYGTTGFENGGADVATGAFDSTGGVPVSPAVKNLMDTGLTMEQAVTSLATKDPSFLDGLSVKDYLNYAVTGFGVVGDYISGKDQADAAKDASAAQVNAITRGQDIQQAQFEEQIRILEEAKVNASGALKENLDNQIATIRESSQQAIQSSQSGFEGARGEIQSGFNDISNMLVDSEGRAVKFGEDLEASNQFRTDEALGLGGTTRELGEQGLSRFSQAALGDDVLNRKLDIDEERTNQSLAARGLLNSSAGLGEIQKGRQNIVDTEEEKQIQRQLQLAQLGQGQIAAGQNILTQGGRDVSGLAERSAGNLYNAQSDVSRQQIANRGNLSQNLGNISQAQGTALSGLQQQQGQQVSNVQGSLGTGLANIQSGLGTQAADATGQYGTNQANLSTQIGNAQSSGIIGQSNANRQMFQDIAGTLGTGFDYYNQSKKLNNKVG